MATPTTIAEAIEQTALNPKVVSTDKGRVEAHDLSELLEAQRRSSSGTSVSKNHFGLSIVRLDFPGAG